MRTPSSLLVVALVSLAVGGACYDEKFVVIPDATEPADAAVTSGDAVDDRYEVEMTYLPTDVHPGDVVNFTFAVSLDGSPVSGLTADGSWQQIVGGTAEGPLSLSPGTEAGTYVGKRAFLTNGTYAITFEFTVGGAVLSRSFEITAQSHD